MVHRTIKKNPVTIGVLVSIYILVATWMTNCVRFLIELVKRIKDLIFLFSRQCWRTIVPNPERKLLWKMETCIKKLKNSKFWSSFLCQMRSYEISNRLLLVLSKGDGVSMQLVIYGIGNIDTQESSRMQLSLAILMKNSFDWIGDIEVFDPAISLMESKVFASLGCTVLTANEHGRRKALKPTLFFMPHCEAKLYNNLLKVNLGMNMLDRVVILGNSFHNYEILVSPIKETKFVEMFTHILAIRRFTKEFKINIFPGDQQAFSSLSWHFFV